MGIPRLNQARYHPPRSAIRMVAAKTPQTRTAAIAPLEGRGADVNLFPAVMSSTNIRKAPAAAARRYASLSSALRASSRSVVSIVAPIFSRELLTCSSRFSDSVISAARACRELRWSDIHHPSHSPFVGIEILPDAGTRDV